MQKTNFSALDRQRNIYVAGMSGQKPAIPVNMDKLKQQARKSMSADAWAYVAGGAGLGSTIDRNRNAFEQYRIIPKMLVDVSKRDLSIELFGEKLSSPLLLSPIGVLEMVHPQADLAVAKAAAAMRVPYIFSNQASKPMEMCAKAMGDAPRWFQLYWSKSNDLVASFVQRAEACGCSAIVVTLDTTMLGWRPLDLDRAFLPFLRAQGIAQYTSDPIFNKMLKKPLQPTVPPPKKRLTLGMIGTIFSLMQNYPGNFLKNLLSGEPLRAVRQFIQVYSRPSLTWDDLSFLRKQTHLPILLKGILHPDDARKAVDMGMDGIVVSNHGGRQVDGAISSLEALPTITKTIDGQIPVLIDGGIRSGSDVFKALALGATAVCIGRPYVYSLAVAGEQGVRELICNMLSDIELTMGLAGCPRIADIKKHCLLRI